MTNQNTKAKINSQLQQLADDEQFKKIQDMLGGVNFFKLTGMGRQETKHSYFLASLFDPHGEHGWGSDFAREFFKNRLGMNLPDTFYNGLQTGRREHKFGNKSRVDLLLYSQDTVVLIENKVDASLHDNQLGKYEQGIDLDSEFHQHNKYYVFLTHDGRLPDADHVSTWKTASYGQIVDSIRAMQKTHVATTNAQREMDVIINHYIKYLRSEVIMNVEILDEEMKALYDSLSKKYPEATAFMSMKRPDEKLVRIGEEISKILLGQAQQRGLVLEGNGIVGSEGRIQFKTKNMCDLTGKTSPKDCPMLYEISADSSNKSKFVAYAWARGFDANDGDVQKVFDACAEYEQKYGRKATTSNDGHRIKFKFDVNVSSMSKKLETDTLELTGMVNDLLDQIEKAEKEIKQFMDNKGRVTK